MLSSLSLRRAGPLCLECASTSSSTMQKRAFSTTLLTSFPAKPLPSCTSWKSKTHLRPSPRVPNPVPSIFPQTVILSDGSSFTSYTTAPTPNVLRLTRDTTNNPLWNPSKEGRRGEGEEEGGRLARFRRMFGSDGQSENKGGAADGTSAVAAGEAAGTTVGSGGGSSNGFSATDLDWMSEEAGVQEKVAAKDLDGPQKAKSKKK